MPEPDSAIVTQRLRLPLLSGDQMRRLGEGEVESVARELGLQLSEEWAGEVRWLAGFRARQLVERPEDAPWLIRPIVRSDTGEAIGYLNFHRAADDRGMVEIGYTLLPAARGNGYALEAVRAAFEWARHERGARVVRASIAPDNVRSINLVTKLGLVHVGEQWDEEDGRELIYEREAWTD